MEINRTSIDVDAAALRGLETRLINASFVQYPSRVTFNQYPLTTPRC